MLKRLDPLLGPDLLYSLRAMGHGDEIAIVDGNYPASSHAKRLIRMDGHGTVAIARAILSVMPLDDFVPETAFRSMAYNDPTHHEPIFSQFDALLQEAEADQKLVPLTGPVFYERAKACYAIVATGERALYGNLILRKGVIRPQ